MTYQMVVDWLFSQLANYHKQGSTAYKPGLENISTLLSRLGNPHLSDEGNGPKFKSVHIAGTNGKGSTAHMIAAMALENGYKVGLYTSPHIKDFRERIKVNGQMIEEAFVVNFVQQNKALFESLQPSFFEITTAMAFVAFAQKNCDYAIIETGLGGRLDATNVLKPEVSVITNIGLDHTEFLGSTLPKIAAEKAGIIKRMTPVVIGEILPETELIFEQKAAAENSRVYLPGSKHFQMDLWGKYQQKNAALAWETIQVLKRKGQYFDNQKSLAALTRIKSLTGFTGRLTKVQSNPTIVVDASHNLAGIQTLMAELSMLEFNHLHCIYGSAADKNYALGMTCFPKEASYYFTSFDSARAVESKVLKAKGDQLGLKSYEFDHPEQALAAAKNRAQEKDLIVVFGSFYILEKII